MKSGEGRVRANESQEQAPRHNGRQLKLVEVLRLRWQATVQGDDAGKKKVEKEGSEQMGSRGERHSVGGGAPQSS